MVHVSQYRVSVAHLQFVHVLFWGLQLCSRHCLIFQFESTCLHVTQNIPYLFQNTNHLFWLFIGVLAAATNTAHTRDFSTDVTIIPKACFDIPIYRLTQSDLWLRQGKPILHVRYSVSCLFQIFFFVALYKLSWQQAMLVRHSGPQQIAVAFKCELLSVLHQQGFLMLKKALVIQTASVKMQDFHCLSSPAQDAFAEALTQTYKLSCYLGAWFWRMS